MFTGDSDSLPCHRRRGVPPCKRCGTDRPRAGARVTARAPLGQYRHHEAPREWQPMSRLRLLLPVLSEDGRLARPGGEQARLFPARQHISRQRRRFSRLF